MTLLPEILNQWSASWLDWAVGGLVDGCLALLAVGLLWLAFGRRLHPRLGAWLFTLVLLKCALPLPVMLPILREALPATRETPSGKAPETSLIQVTHPTSEVGASLESGGAEPPTRHLTAASWLLLVWLVGVLLHLLRVAWLWKRTRSLVDRARLVGAEVVEGLPSLVWRVGCRGPLSVRLSRELRSPAVAGWFKPVLLLPEGLQERLSPGQHRWVLAHELAHIRAGDIPWQWAELLFRAVFYFHPAVWLASAQSARLRERACDEEALHVSGTSRQSSAQGFVSLIEWSQKPVALAGLSLGSAGREASARVRALASGPPRQAGLCWQVSAGLLCAIVVLPSFRAGTVQAQVQTQAEPETLRIAALEQRILDLEKQLQAKSRLESLREGAIHRAHQRVAADEASFSAEQLREIERLYQEARKSATGHEMGRAFQPLFDRFPKANRTGCAMLLLARLLQGAEREALLRKAINEHGDAYFLDGTSVGGVARLMLAQDAQAAGRDSEAQQWREQIQKSYAAELDFGAVPLGDLLNAPANPH